MPGFSPAPSGNPFDGYLTASPSPPPGACPTAEDFGVAPPPVDPALEASFAASGTFRNVRVSLTGANFLPMTRVDVPVIRYAARVGTFFDSIGVDPEAIHVLVAGRDSLIVYGFRIPGSTAGELVAAWVAASRVTMPDSAIFATGRLAGHDVTVMRALHEHRSDVSDDETVLAVGDVLYVVDSFGHDDLIGGLSSNPEVKVLVAELPPTPAAPVGPCPAPRGWPVHPPADPQLEASMPDAVLDARVYRFSQTGEESLGFARGAGDVCCMQSGERVPMLYRAVGANVAEVTVAVGGIDMPETANPFDIDDVRVYAYRIPGANADDLVSAWANATKASFPQMAASTFRFGTHDATVLYLGTPTELVYATGDTLYVIYALSMFEPEFSRYIGGFVQLLP